MAGISERVFPPNRGIDNSNEQIMEMRQEIQRLKIRLSLVEDDSREHRAEHVTTLSRQQGELDILKPQVAEHVSLPAIVQSCVDSVNAVKIQVKTILAMSKGRGHVRCICGNRVDLPLCKGHSVDDSTSGRDAHKQGISGKKRLPKDPRDEAQVQGVETNKPVQEIQAPKRTATVAVQVDAPARYRNKPVKYRPKDTSTQTSLTFGNVNDSGTQTEAEELTELSFVAQFGSGPGAYGGSQSCSMTGSQESLAVSEASDFPPPTAKMRAMDGKACSTCPNAGPVSLSSPEGVWMFRPTAFHTWSNMRNIWKQIITQGAGTLFSSPVLLPCFLGGWIAVVGLKGIGKGKLELGVGILSTKHNKKVVLPLKIDVSITIKGRTWQDTAFITEKDSPVNVLVMESANINSVDLPPIRIQFYSSKK